jgi:hypothetical protein
MTVSGALTARTRGCFGSFAGYSAPWKKADLALVLYIAQKMAMQKDV